MPLEDFITWIYCWVDDECTLITAKTPLRERGFTPALSDSEVITMEIVGEFLGIDTNKGIWSYFRSHWSSCFPMIGSRSQFAKQATNLWAVKQKMQEKRMPSSKQDSVHIVDGFPIEISHFKRAKSCRRFKGEASYGYCASKEETYYGFKGHLLVNLEGEISGFTLSEAKGSEREAVWELTDGVLGLLLGDKGYIGADFKAELKKQGLELETPAKSNMKDAMPKCWRKQLNRIRRRVETSIGQLVEQFNIQKTKARSLLSLTNRLTRKLLAHGLGVLANREAGNEPLQLAKVLQ